MTSKDFYNYGTPLASLAGVTGQYLLGDKMIEAENRIAERERADQLKTLQAQEANSLAATNQIYSGIYNATAGKQVDENGNPITTMNDMFSKDKYYQNVLQPAISGNQISLANTNPNLMGG